MKIIYSLLFVLFSFAAFAQPANDDCSGAINLGSLPTPAVCPSGVGANTSVTGSITTATPGNPYIFQNSCTGSSTTMASPAKDVWYKFTATGYTGIFSLTGTITNPNIALYSGTCAALGGGIGGCAIGTGAGAVTLTVNQMVIGQTYYIQISGNSTAGNGNFTLTAHNIIGCADCMTSSTLTVTPSPINGAYSPGTTVSFCYHIDNYAEINTNWMHGVQLAFGAGWNLGSLVATPAAAYSCGTWNYYPAGTVSSASGVTWPAGYYFDRTCTPLGGGSSGDGNPGNNYGDHITANTTGDQNIYAIPAATWDFCFHITTANTCSPGSDLSLTINTSGDGESGIWSSVGCTGDPATVFHALGACCAPTMSFTPTSCAGGSNGTATATPVGVQSPFTYSWSPGGQTTQTATGLSAGTYTCYVTDKNLCQISNTVTVTSPTALTATSTHTNEVCGGGTTATATATPSGGTGAYTYSWNTTPAQTTATATTLPAGTYTCTVTDHNGCTTTTTVTITEPTTLTATNSQVNILCNGASTGTATAIPAGGTGAYTYSWNSAPSQTTATATGLPAGTYVCTITDHVGCTTTTSVTITQPAVLTATNSQTNVLCHGGSTGTATASPSGGSGAYTYSWNSAPSQTTATATGLPIGTYTCTIKDHNGCSTTTVVTITQPVVLAVTNSQTNVVCSGGATGTGTVVPTGGTVAYTYSWAPAGSIGGGQSAATATGLAAGSYVCTITDNKGCTITSGVTLTQPAAIVIGTSSTIASCGTPSGSASVTSTSGGTGAYTYSWTPAASIGTGQGTTTAGNLGAGTYTITVTDNNGCAKSTTVAVSNAGGPTAVISASTNPSCNGAATGSATVTAANGTGAYTYSWDCTPSQSTATATGLPAGNYTVTVTDNAGCQTSASVTLTQPAPVAATNSQVNNICNGTSAGSATVNPTGGTGVYTYSWTPAASIGGGQGSFTATGLAAGVYTCTITDHNGCSTTSIVTITQPPPPTETPSQTNVSCNGGSDGTVTVTPGGVATYTYSWNTTPVQTTATATGLPVGTYTCTITDQNACVFTGTVTLTEPPALTLTTTTVASTCGNPNGSATVHATGGTGLYTYSWAPSGGSGSTANALLAGNYTVTVTDANNCTQNSTAVVTNIGGPSVSILSSTNVSCNGLTDGSATVNATGGTGALTYSWAPSGGAASTANGLAAGTYTCSVDDANGCPNSVTVTITQPSPLTATSTQVNESCNGGISGSATITPSGGTTTYSYSWTPSGGTGATSTSSPAGTYTCTVTDAHGCTLPVVVTITEPTAIVLTKTQVNELCQGASTGSATVGATGGTGSYTYAWSPSGGNAAAASGLAAGTYTCTVSDANGCNNSSVVTITEPPALTLSTSSTPSTCSAANGSATAAPAGGTGTYTYSWNPGSGAAATFSGQAAGTYTCTVTDANGCSISATATIVNQGTPVVTLGTVTNATCFGLCNGTATVNASGGTGTLTYSWTPTGGAGTTASALCPNTYTCTVTDANGCATSITTPITEPKAVVVTIPASTNVSCSGGSNGSATASATGGTGTFTYSWFPSGGSSPAATGLAAGLYTVTVTDANGCAQTDTITITQPSPLTISLAGVKTKCNGSCDGVLICIPAGGTSPYSYSWNTGCSAPSCSGVCAGTYTLQVTDANGCTASGTTTVNQPSAITLNMFSVPAHCNHPDGTDSVSASGGTPGVGGYTYSWSPGAGSAASAYHNVPPGLYVATVTDANGCTTKDSLPVLNTPGVVATIVSTKNASCYNGTNGWAVAGGTGGTLPYSYLWAPPATSVLDSGTNLGAGTYYVLVTDAKGCTSQDSAVIYQPTQVLVTPMTVYPICIGQCMALSATGSGGTPGYTYTWTQGGSPAVSPVCPIVPTTYTVTATDANGCPSAAVLVPIFVHPPLQIVAVGDSAVCPGGTVQLNATASGGDGNYSYSWSTALGLNSTTIPNPTASPATTTTYTVVVKDGCGTPVAIATDTVKIYPTPTLVFAANDTAGCVPLCVVFSGLSNPACKNSVWTFGDGLTANGCNSVTHCYTQPGLYSVTQQVTDIHGCQNVFTRPNYIDAWPKPKAAFILGPQPATIVLSEISFTDESTGPVRWLWSFGDFSNASSTLQNPKYTYPDTGCFTSQLIIWNSYGCKDTAYGPLCIHPDFSFYAPNAFTPNGDNKNDLWRPLGLGIDPNTYHMMMFDRWGNLMWETKVWDEGWDGKANNGDQIAQIDTYVWKCTVSDFLGNKHAFTGVCNLIK